MRPLPVQGAFEVARPLCRCPAKAFPVFRRLLRLCRPDPLFTPLSQIENFSHISIDPYSKCEVSDMVACNQPNSDMYGAGIAT